MAVPDKDRSEKYRKKKSKTHSRVSMWFINDLIKKIDENRGVLSRAAWVIKVVNEKLHK